MIKKKNVRLRPHAPGRSYVNLFPILWPMLEVLRPGGGHERTWLIMLLHDSRPPSSNSILMHEVLHRSYWYPPQWTGTDLQVRLMQKSFQMQMVNLYLIIFPRMIFHRRLDPVQ